jgi:hypothetical protein
MYLITLPNSSSGEHKYLMYSCIVMMRLVSTLWTCLNYNTLTHNRFHPSVDLRKKKYRKIESLRRWFREIKNIKRKWKVHHTTNLCLFLMIYVETDTSSTEHHWASQTPLNTRGGGGISVAPDTVVTPVALLLLQIMRQSLNVIVAMIKRNKLMVICDTDIP